ncbi:MAG: tRNA pseudouridine(55) synthase TruB, partial [Actinomycetota bacterium]
MTAPAPPGAGVWLVDKPAGPTSHDVVARIRRGLGRRAKVGHTGTLDPFATGLLVILTGRATRLAAFLSDRDKTYEAVFRLGAVSASGDPEGPVTEVAPPPPREQVDAALPGLTGRIRQQVPALAAVKVGGEALYRRTRRGEEVEAPVRDVEIHRFAVRGYDPASGRLDCEVRCGKGTYIRQLAADLGAAIGCGGYCLELRRTEVGDLRVADAVAPEDVDAGPGIGVAAALRHLPLVAVDAGQAVAVSHGRPVPGDADGPVLVACEGVAVAVAR